MKQTKIIPFDLSLVTDDNVYTKNGNHVRIISTNRKHDPYQIVGLIEINDEDMELCETFTTEGYYKSKDVECGYDLVIHQEIDVDLHFEPFQKVLVRHGERGTWRPAFYSHKLLEETNEGEVTELYYIIGDRRGYQSIIPYDDFKHLCYTSENPKF